jgi:hypothetical protein
MNSRLKMWAMLLAILALLLAAAGCNDGGSGDGLSPEEGVLMGGCIQGRELDLGPTVDTLVDDQAALNAPRLITTDGTNLYLANYDNGTISQVDIATGQISVLAGGFSSFEGVTTDGTNVYVADRDRMIICQVVIATGEITTLAGSWGLSGLLDGTGSAARFYFPMGITTDGTNLYVIDAGNVAIRQIVIATQEVTTLATGLSDPVGIVTDGTDLYVTSALGNLIYRVVIATGEVTTLATGFDRPLGITTDGTNLYVVNQDTNTICQVVIATGDVTTLAGTGAAGADDGPGNAATFNGPHGITTDGTSLFVTDGVVGSYSVREIY